MIRFRQNSNLKNVIEKCQRLLTSSFISIADVAIPSTLAKLSEIYFNKKELGTY